MYGHVAIKMTRHQPIRPLSLYEVVPHSRDKNEYLFMANWLVARWLVSIVTQKQTFGRTSQKEWTPLLVNGTQMMVGNSELNACKSLERTTGLLSMKKWTDNCVGYLSLVAWWSVIIDLTLASRVSLLFPGRGREGGEGKTSDPGYVVTLILITF